MQKLKIRNCLLAIILSVIVCNSYYCSPSIEQSGKKSLWKNVYDTAVHYVGMEKCRICHEPVYQSFIQTGMGQSFGAATQQKSAADFNPASALVYDSFLDFYYKPFWNNDSLYIMEYRLEGRDTVHRLTQKIDYIIGSGQHTNSHLFSVNGYLYQAPITFYTQKRKWDLAPGFEKGANSRFQRKIEPECITCHNGYPEFIENSDNKFYQVKTGIDCERCHGPGSLHVKEKSVGIITDTSKTPDYSIVNPRRLSADLQNNICQRCHLQGITVLNTGKTFFDFRPGMQLSEVMNTFLPEYEGAKDKMLMASHVERMKKSRCFLETGKLSCVTCHNPHISVRNTPRQNFINVCVTCHAESNGKGCKEAPMVRATKSNDCIVCHMPHTGSIDIPHVAVTDHFIRRKPADDTLKKNITAFNGMRCFNNANPDAITIAKAYLEFYERYVSSAGLLDSAILFLNKQKNAEEKIFQNNDFIRAWFLQGNYEQIIERNKKRQTETIKDAWTAYRLGESYFQAKIMDTALFYFSRATELKKYSLDFENRYAAALLAMGNYEKATDVCRFILNENPHNALAATNLGYIFLLTNKNDSAYLFFKLVENLDPDNTQNLINLAVWYHNNNNYGEAGKYLNQLLKKHPENRQARAMLEDLKVK